ncbi:hypothetical protein O0L34_g208 [Tuta absoluta]|nr:hypothetical protein O0L34_g208 [Tuta absoluta]
MNRLSKHKILILVSVFVLYLLNITKTFSFIGTFRIYLTDREYFHDVESQLLDLKDFKYIRKSEECKDSLGCDGVYLVITIFSALKNTEERKMIRNTWQQNGNKCIKLVFLLGTVDNYSINKAIDEESALHADIVQGNFIDTYRNLTYKHVMGLKWVTRYCRKTQFMLKIDDDVTISPEMFRLTIQHRLGQGYSTTDYIACNPLRNSSVMRKSSKWTVPKEEYHNDTYPDYCDGKFLTA